MSSETSSPSALERMLAFSSLSIIAIALLSFFATLIVGMSNSANAAKGLWPLVYGVSLYGLPIGFVLLIALLIVTQRRRKHELKRGSENRK